jgi:hypothetical protein
MNEVKTNKKEITSKVKTTRGDILNFDRIAWNYMKRQLKLPEAEILKMNEARCPAKVNNMETTLIRYFNPKNAAEKGLTINDFVSLNEHPELVQYEGYYVHGKGGEIIIKRTESVGTSLLDEKIKKGDITEVGAVKEKTAAQKWLGRIGAFMMMGGFMLVLFVIAALIVVISIATKSC